MKRREAIKAIGTGALVPFGKGLATGQQRNSRPNIIFIMSDDHAAHAIGSYGSVINKTPNLDRIAQEGIRFNNCFCTNAICAPSRAVILTGKYSHLNGVTDNIREFDSSQQTYPKLLRQAGYQTAMIGKWHLKSDPTDFDYWNILPGQGHYYNPDLIEMGQKKQFHGYVTDIITDSALNWLDIRQPEKPFCLIFQHKAPHRNWMPDPAHFHMYEDEDISVPDTFFDAYGDRPAADLQEMTVAHHMYLSYDLKITPPGNELDERLWKSCFNRLTEEQKALWEAAYGPQNEIFHKANLEGEDLARYKYLRYIKDYLRCIASLDDNVGRLLNYLETSGLTNNTIVVYTSDQGFFLGDHGWFDKRFMYEESLRMPLLVRYPEKIKPSSVADDIALNLDFAPTFLDYAGIDIPSDMQGASLRPVMEDLVPSDWRKSMYYHYYEFPSEHRVRRHYGIRTKRYKLMHFYYDIDGWELYDLDNDVGELNNVYEDPAYSNVVKELKLELQTLREKYGDTDDILQRILSEDLARLRGNKQ